MFAGRKWLYSSTYECVRVLAVRRHCHRYFLVNFGKLKFTLSLNVIVQAFVYHRHCGVVISNVLFVI